MRTTGGGPDDESLFIQRMAPNEILLRQASNGVRVTGIQSVDDSAFVAFCEHDCDSSTTRSSSGSSNILFTGHDNGVIQLWDLATAGVMFKKGKILNGKLIFDHAIFGGFLKNKFEIFCEISKFHFTHKFFYLTFA